MRILVLSNLYPPHYIGGYELRCRDLSEAFHQRGHTIQVLTSDHGTSDSDVKETSPFTVERSLRLHGFYGHAWLGIRALAHQERHNNAMLTAAIRTFKPDLVHVWNLGGISKSLALTLQSMNIPTVFDVSDHWIARSLVGDVWLDWWNRKSGSTASRIRRWVSTTIGNRDAWNHQVPTNPLHHLKFQRLYFCSQRLREITAAAGYPVNHGTVIHCPVDTDRYTGSVAPPTAPLKDLLYAGRLSEDKGIFTAIKAIHHLKGHFDGTLHVYGKGDPAYESMLHDYVKRNGLSVSFHSATPEEMPEVYRSHDAVLFTSEWEEPFALTPLEAMACGRPVIGTLTGGSAELLRHEENALTYTAGDSHELADRIMTLANDAELRARIAAAGQHHVRERLNLPRIVAQVERYLNETLTTWQDIQLPHYNAA